VQLPGVLGDLVIGKWRAY